MKPQFTFVVLVSLLGALILSGCEIKNLDDNSLKTSDASSTNQTLTAEVIEGKSFNEFSVKLNLPNGQNYLVARENLNALDTQKFDQILVSSDYLDKTVKPGNTYTYSIGAMQGMEFVKAQDVTISIPMDVKVDQIRIISPEEISAWTNIRSLVFYPNGILVTNGQDVVIRAKKITSQDGSIQSFLAGSTASQGNPGRSGGDIQIETDDAEGLLKIIMRGENGGKGLNGEPGPQFQDGGPGFQGLNGGDSGLFHFRKPPNLKFEITHEVGKAGVGGDGGTAGRMGVCRPGKQEISLITNAHVQSICADDPSSTHAGPQGPPGKDGIKGKSCEISSVDGTEDCE